MIFIDGSNLFHACEELKVRIDYGKLRDFLTNAKPNRRLIRAHFYGSTPKVKRPEQEAFHTRLRYMGWEVKIYPLREFGVEARSKEKEVDISLVTDLLLYGHKDLYDVAILVTGDKDYKPAIKAVKEMGKWIEIAAFEHTIAEELKLEVGIDNYICLDKLIDHIKRTKSV
ncbi:MAG: NYN domain protein [Candidatus Bathyarchaeota archaeon BA2]|nr:MAG: NYN domain protein [Candidatus Bathyarchaeota archaeon BA2]